jgi:tetratricopeptide (TPR) repeat protein
VVVALAVAAPAWGQGPDLEAMREAMSEGAPEPTHAPAASYAHFLAARLAHQEGRPKEAAAQLQLALATAGGNPFLRTELAEELARLGEWRRARRELEDVLQGWPRYGPALMLLGQIWAEQHEPLKARTYLKRAARLDPEAYLLLAQVALQLKRLEEALEAVDAYTRARGEPSALKRMGEVLAEKGDGKRAEALLLRATAMDPGDAEAWTTLAQVQEALGKDAAAEASYGRALERDVDDTEALLSAGRVALRRHEMAGAKAYFAQLLGVAHDAETVVKVAFSYLAAGHLPLAAQTLDDARRAGVHEPRVAFYSGLLHERVGDDRGAAEAFLEVLDDKEVGREARLHLGPAWARVGRYHDAIALLGSAVQDHPDDVALYPLLGRVLEESGDGVGAERFLRAALVERPTAQIYGALADLLQRAGRSPEAIALLESGLRRQPGDAILHFSLAAVFERAGDLDRGLAQMREVLAVDPNNAAAMNFIGYTLAEKGEGLAEAERLLLRAVELKPDSGAFMDSLGWLYFRRGDFTRAVGALEQAERLAPNEPLIIEHLGDAYHGVEQDVRAAEAYHRALEALRESKDQDGLHQRAGIEHKLKLLSPEAEAR